MKLVGLRVLDLSSFLPGPYLTLALADHGAEVIKVEKPPSGDHGRQIGLRDGAETVFFKNLNRGKKSIMLDLKKPADRATCLGLADQSDIVVESSRPGVAARLGLDYNSLAARNPGVIYCAITAFGQTGPLAGRPAHDLALQAMTGVLGTNVDATGEPVNPAIPTADYLAGLQGLAGVLMALQGRQLTGRGDYIDISMQECLLAATLNVLGPTMAEGRQPVPRLERTTGGSAFYRAYRTADARRIVIAGQEAKFIDALLGALGRRDLAPLCQQPGAHQEPVVELLQGTFERMTLAQIDAWLTPLDICWAPVKTFPEALDDPQIAERNLILRDEAGRRHIGSPIRFRHEPALPELKVPSLDEHSAELRTKIQGRGPW